MKIVELLGPQPIMNLLPIRYLHPDEILFVGTPETHDKARHLENMLKRQTKIHLTEVRRPHDPYDVQKLVTKKLRTLGWEREKVVFDISGGSKMEALAIAQDIQVIELPGYMDGRRLPQQEKNRLVDTVKQSLGGQRR